MSFSNPSHKGRLALISSVKDVSAILRSYPFAGAKPVRLEGSDLLVMYQGQEVETSLGDTTFHVPFLFHKSGIPWHEANDYLLQSIKNKTHKNLRNDDLRRIAGRLLDYLMFCEARNLDWLDFTGSRPAFRPTYKYFDYLVNQSGRGNAVINQYTAAIYELYKYVSSSWHVIDINRVDTVRDISFFVKYGEGGTVVSRKKRGQTLSVPPKGRVPLGFVLEDGEFLRPLANSELSCLLKLLSSEKEWPMQERLILLMSLMTGARKQTILTMRLRHLEAFNPSKLLLEGAYKLHAGPGTGMDTKKGVPQILYVPKQLAEEVLVFFKSPLMTARRAKLRSNIETSGYQWVEEDAYLFISDQGNCCYMAKDDPRYREVKSRQTGQVTDNMRRKLIGSQEAEFPKDFSFHWLRATYAYQLYQRLQKLIGNGMLKPGEDIQFIQRRMHHRSRKTTEDYLKLFLMSQETVVAQEVWEGVLFNGSYDVLNVGKDDV
ncbi:site-specific integrase [Pseudomonas sp. NPDC088368]|jgi:integrase|uniref:site-specific integrase n=1 Tax=Pseudomonas sp. NPDC088368 TaxID=3364453 RepID=UPI0038084240